MDLFELMPFGLQTIMIEELAGLRRAPQPSSSWRPEPREFASSIDSQAVQPADGGSDFDIFDVTIPKPHDNAAVQKWREEYDGVNLTSKIKGWLNFFDGKSLAEIGNPKTTPENIKLTQGNMAKIANALEQENYEEAGKDCLEELSRVRGPKNYIEQYGIYFWMRLFKLMPPPLKARVVQDLAGLLSPKQQAVAATTPAPAATLRHATPAATKPSPTEFLMQRYKAILHSRGLSHEEIDKMRVSVKICVKEFNEAVKDLLSNYTEPEILENIVEIVTKTPASGTFGELILMAGLYNAGEFAAMEACVTTATKPQHFITLVKSVLRSSKRFYEFFGGRIETMHLITQMLANFSKSGQYQTLLNTFRCTWDSRTPISEEMLKERTNIVMDLLDQFDLYSAQPSSPYLVSKKQELQQIIFSQLYPNDDGHYAIGYIWQLEQQVAHYFNFNRQQLRHYVDSMIQKEPPQEEVRPASDFTP